MQSSEAVTSISGHDASFAAGLVEAGVQVACGRRPVLLVAYDLPYPEPLHTARRIEASFGVAFVLGPVPSGRGFAELSVRMAPTGAGEASRCHDLGLEALRRGNPAARALPLLTMLAARSAGAVRLDLSHGLLDVDVVPC
jgi:hypothetical protein